MTGSVRCPVICYAAQNAEPIVRPIGEPQETKKVNGVHASLIRASLRGPAFRGDPYGAGDSNRGFNLKAPGGPLGIGARF